ncbi:MAG: single-stranded DNA-binding protein [Firmicutes bacterium]|nr:single-stranded DNA-binding protein [Bacillota bacterium]
MNNTMFAVGRLTEDPKIEKTPNGRVVSNITIAVPRTYKNENGEYDTDFLDCVFWGEIANNATKYCKKGDLVGVRGRLENNTFEVDGQNHKVSKIIADKISFLSTRKEIDEEKDKNAVKDKKKTPDKEK